jgi:hypothetical protein
MVNAFLKKEEEENNIDADASLSPQFLLTDSVEERRIRIRVLFEKLINLLIN